MVDDAEKSDGNKVEGGMSREHLKAMVNVRKKSKKVVQMKMIMKIEMQIRI